MRTFKIVLVLSLISFALFSQDKPNSLEMDLRKDALNVYMRADNYVKEQIPFINYVRDKADADLIIIYTSQNTGSGGKEHIYYIEGQLRYEGELDTLRFSTNTNDTADEIRSSKVRILKIGLAKYIVNTPLAMYFDLNFNKPISAEVSTDNWNNWVFNIGLNGGLNGSESSTSLSLGTHFNTSRVTDDWRLSFTAYNSYSKTDFSYYGISASTTEKASGFTSDIVRSISDHLSVGFAGDITSSIFNNYDLKLKIEPVIEYNFYPYSQSTRRQLRLVYGVAASYNNYIDTTQFFKTEEYLLSHMIHSSYSIIQKWGTIGVSSTWRNYLHDFSINNFNLGSLVSLRVVKGLSVTVYATYSFIHDQISLRKGDVSAEDVFLNRQELSTSFSFRSGFGITYTFGSLYNNIVNPRISSLFYQGDGGK